MTEKSRRKLQSTDDFIDATKTVQIPNDYKYVFFSCFFFFKQFYLQDDHLHY